MQFRQIMHDLARAIRETIRGLSAILREPYQWFSTQRLALRVALVGAVVIAALVVYRTWPSPEGVKSDLRAASSADAAVSAATAADQDNINLSESQLAAVKVEPVQEHDFPVEKSAVGSIDFNEDLETQVFTPYQGKIIALYAEVGDDVKKDQTLFTIDSPDLLNTESNLIAAVGVMDLTTRNLARLKELYETRAVSQHDLDQGISDQMTA